MLSITFIDKDFQTINPKQDDPMVIMAEVVEFNVMKTLMD